MNGKCFLCGERGYVEEHHIFGGPNRRLSEKHKLKVHLCPDCHRNGNHSAHRNAETAEKLHIYGEELYLKRHPGETIDDFRAIFGRNYL